MNKENTLSARDDWSRHWDEYAESAQLNPAQEYRRRIIFRLLGSLGDGSGVRLLDIGSGQGDFAAEVKKTFPSAQILGLELSQSGIRISQAKVPDARFEQRNLLETQDPPVGQRGWATHAVCSEVIEHVDEPSQLLRRARDYMAPRCKLIVTAPGGPMSAFDRHIGHRKHFNTQEITALLTQEGYESQCVLRAGFPFFNLYRLAVILRGKTLIEDLKGQNRKGTPFLAGIVMSAFHFLFRFNIASSPWGWQIAATGLMRDPKNE